MSSNKIVINDIKLFLIYCHKFTILSNQMSHYKGKCIKMSLIAIVQDLQTEVCILQVERNTTTEYYIDCLYSINFLIFSLSSGVF